MGPAFALLVAAVAASSLSLGQTACTTQTAVNGPVGNYVEVINNIPDAAACEAQCTRNPSCTVFKFCNSPDACKNYWSKGGPDDAYMSCTLAKGPFKAQAPNDWTVGGFTIGQCSATAPQPALPADAATKNLKGNVIQSSTTASAAECAAQCAAKAECNGYNFCTSAVCGMVGQCDLKQFATVDYWGDSSSTPGDGWVSGGIKVTNTAPTQTAANFGGNVLVLDVNSMTYQGGPNHPGQGVSTAEECAAACKAKAGCNTWVFCGATEQRAYGCGQGCSRPANEYDPKNPNDSSRFGMYNGCACPGSNAPDRTDCYWPAGMCSLKYNAGQPPVYESGSKWISGMV